MAKQNEFQTMRIYDEKFLEPHADYSFIPENEDRSYMKIADIRNRKTVIGSLIMFLFALVFGAKQLLNHLYSEGGISSIKFSNEYPKMSSLSSYSWKHVVEPNKETTLSIGLSSKNSGCLWRITKANGEVVGKYTGCGDIKHTFTKVSEVYTVNVAYNENTLAEEAVCKYVRRELRDLTEFDRTTYFSALELIHRLDLDEGQAQFGSNFKNYNYFTTKHLNAYTEDNCFPFVGNFRGSNAFLTAHSAFTLELEQALQAIDPSLTQPYWDFTIDAELGEDWRTESDLFGYDYYGSLSPHTRVVNNSKMFSYLPSVYATQVTDDIVTKNSYGKLTNRMNQDSSAYVTRGGPTVCSVLTASLPTSRTFNSCDSSSLTAWRECLETTVHAYISLGGAWSCPYLLSNFPEAIQALLARNANNLWNIAQHYGVLSCPESCSTATLLDDCRCSCSALSSHFMDAVLKYLYDVTSFESTYSSKEMLITKTIDQGQSAYSFNGFSEAESNEIIEQLATFVCAPGVLGALSTDAAPNDPMFWILHLMYDRAWAIKRLKGDLSVDDWVEGEEVCQGGSPSAVLPFKFGDSSDYMTNSQLYLYFDPSNKQLPYIYDSF